MSEQGEAHRRKSAERRQQAVDLKDSGLSNREVGLKLGVRREWARNLVRRGRLEREYQRIHDAERKSDEIRF